MLGKRPCLLRTTSSQSLLLPCDDAEREPSTFCNCTQAKEKNTCPALSIPSKIVIGFDIGGEKKPPDDASDNPFTVLDTFVLLPSPVDQHVMARAPPSGSGSFLRRRNMLEKRPCLLRSTSSQSILIPCDNAEGDPATFCSYTQVTEKNSCPALSAPQKIVIGFDIGGEKKIPSDVCESPRSVLDMLTLLPSQEKQHVAARSSGSVLGSLLTAKSGSEVGPGAACHIQTEQVGALMGSFKATFCMQNCLHENSPTNKTILYVKTSHSHSKGIGWLDQASDTDFMDADMLSWQRQAPSNLHVEDEYLDADISPRRSQVIFIPPSEDTNANFTHLNISLYQSRALDACFRMGAKDDCVGADIFPQCSQAPWQLGELHASTSRGVTNKEHIIPQVSPWQSRASYAPGIVGADDDCSNSCIPTWQSGALSLCEDGCADGHISPRQRQASHQMRLDIEESEEISIQRSIFSAASPPTCPQSLVRFSSGFLKKCAFCGHSLPLGKDIYMYRGDQAFCSAECRYQKIVQDELKEKQGSPL